VKIIIKATTTQTNFIIVLRFNFIYLAAEITNQITNNTNSPFILRSKKNFKNFNLDKIYKHSEQNLTFCKICIEICKFGRI